jgi:hypothetical protein
MKEEDAQKPEHDQEKQKGDGCGQDKGEDWHNTTKHQRVLFQNIRVSLFFLLAVETLALFRSILPMTGTIHSSVS